MKHKTLFFWFIIGLVILGLVVMGCVTFFQTAPNTSTASSGALSENLPHVPTNVREARSINGIPETVVVSFPGYNGADLPV